MRPIFVDPRDIRNVFLYAIVIGVIPLGIVILALWIVGEKYLTPILYTASGIALMGIFIVYWFFDRIPRGPNEMELKKRMAEMMERGEVLARESSEPLTAAEINWLTRLNYILTAALTVVMGGIAYVSYYPAKELAGDPWTLVIPLGLGVLFSFLVYKYSLLLPKVVKAGKKEVVQGLITSRQARADGHSLDYFLTVGKKELQVSKRDYRTYNVGELVRIDFIKDFGNMVLKITRMN